MMTLPPEPLCMSNFEYASYWALDIGSLICMGVLSFMTMKSDFSGDQHETVSATIFLIISFMSPCWVVFETMVPSFDLINKVAGGMLAPHCFAMASVMSFIPFSRSG
jgi:hypothetical protein